MRGVSYIFLLFFFFFFFFWGVAVAATTGWFTAAGGASTFTGDAGTLVPVCNCHKRCKS